jgi:diguanylate cyclase (GGDEF)-like protein
MKQNLKQMLPVAVIIGITVVMSLLLYQRVMIREEESCWKLLEDSSNSVTKEMQITFTNDINVLHLAADMIEQDMTGRFDTKELEVYRQSTTFSRVDVIYPGDRIMFENGTEEDLRSDLSFDVIVRDGEHMSARMMDTETGKEAVYYFVPVKKNGETIAVLAGVLESSNLVEEFHPAIYEGNASYCIIDSRDGNYIMDAWHDVLENAYTTPDRTRLKGYEDIDLKKEVKAQKTGVIAFESRTTGKPLYMYYMPLNMFDWELQVFVQEDVAFAKQIYLRKLLIGAGILEAGLLFIYFFWNLRQVRNLRKSKMETLEQLNISNTMLECVTALSSDRDIDTAIQNLLQIINDYFKADRTYIFLHDTKKDVFIDTYEYDAPNVQGQMSTMPEIPASVLVKGIQAFNESKAYYIPDTEQEKENYRFFQGRDIKRVLAVPIYRGKVITGFVSVDNPKESYDDATILSSIQFFISNSLATKEYQDQLRFMSYWDELTSLYNRNKYMQLLIAHRHQVLEKVGVAYLDLNGLKTLNDQKGHETGDALICTAARIINGIYPENTYRIGGDEFVVLELDVEENVFKEKIRLLRNEMQRQKVSVSIGALWKEHCEDLDELLKEADRRMYEEKNLHYQENSVKRQP